MALFKILKGQKADLPATKHEGYAYVTADEHKMYIDITDSSRIALNSDLADRIPFATCPTAGTTAAKIVTTTDPFTLSTGSVIAIKFTNASPQAETTQNNIITFNVNNTGAKNVYYRGARIPNEFFVQNKIYLFIYNGTQYELVGDVIPDLNDNEMVITDENGQLDSRKFVDSYQIVEQLPTSNINQNVVYLVATGESSGGGSGSGSGSNLTYGLSRTPSTSQNITLTASNGTTSSVEALNSTQVQALIDSTITTALTTSYPQL